MIAEVPVQIPNLVPSAEHTNAPALEQGVEPADAVEPVEAPAAGVAAAADGEAAAAEARIVAVPGTAAEGDAA